MFLYCEFSHHARGRCDVFFKGWGARQIQLPPISNPKRCRPRRLREHGGSSTPAVFENFIGEQGNRAGSVGIQSTAGGGGGKTGRSSRQSRSRLSRQTPARVLR